MLLTISTTFLRSSVPQHFPADLFSLSALGVVVLWTFLDFLVFVLSSLHLFSLTSLSSIAAENALSSVLH